MKTWIVPALLSSVVALLVLSTRRAPSTTVAPPAQPRQRPPADASTTPPSNTAPPAPPRPPAEPEIVLEPGSILDVYRSLMGAMQADIRSIDPTLLEKLAQKLDAFGHFEEAKLARGRATCAREAREVPNDPDFFPLSCALPGHVIFEAPPVITQATADLLTRYVEAMGKNLYATDAAIPTDKRASSISVPTLDGLIRQLGAANFAQEASSLRARRDQLYKQKQDHALTRLRTAASFEIDRETFVARELIEAGYQSTLGDSLYAAIDERRRELASRNAVCNVRAGCLVKSSTDEAAAAIMVTLPNKTHVTVKHITGPWSLVEYDDPATRPLARVQGWILTQALTSLPVSPS